MHDIEIPFFLKRPHALPFRQAAAMIVLNARGEILMGLQKDDSLRFSNIWKLPSGRVRDKDQGSEANAALRKVGEETRMPGVTIIGQAREYYKIEFPAEPATVLKGAQGLRMKFFLGRTDIPLRNLDYFVSKVPPDRNFTQLRWAKPLEALQLAHNNQTGDVVSLQTQKIYRAALTEFGLLQLGAAQPVTVQSQRDAPTLPFDKLTLS